MKQFVPADISPLEQELTKRAKPLGDPQLNPGSLSSPIPHLRPPVLKARRFAPIHLRNFLQPKIKL